MPRSKSLILSIVLVLALSFCTISCAQRAPLKTAKAPAPSLGNPEADADAALGVLPEKGKTEAEKQAKGVEEENEEDQALQELRKKEMEEEQRRLHKTITDDQIAGQR